MKPPDNPPFASLLLAVDSPWPGAPGRYLGDRDVVHVSGVAFPVTLKLSPEAIVNALKNAAS